MDWLPPLAKVSAWTSLPPSLPRTAAGMEKGRWRGCGRRCVTEHLTTPGAVTSLAGLGAVQASRRLPHTPHAPDLVLSPCRVPTSVASHTF